MNEGNIISHQNSVSGNIISHTQEEWDIHMLKIAKLCSEMSKDPSTKVGAVIVSSDHKVISMGYNGFPKEIPDYKEWYYDRKKKYELIVHAELNALNNTESDIPSGSSIYVYPLKPCKNCYDILKSHGIKRFVSVFHDCDTEFLNCSICSSTSSSNQCSTSRWSHDGYFTDEDTMILITKFI
jgi:dCMP deaminase